MEATEDGQHLWLKRLHPFPSYIYRVYSLQRAGASPLSINRVSTSTLEFSALPDPASPLIHPPPPPAPRPPPPAPRPRTPPRVLHTVSIKNMVIAK